MVPGRVTTAQGASLVLGFSQEHGTGVVTITAALIQTTPEAPTTYQQCQTRIL